MAFIYQADVWCDQCGRRICEELKQAGTAPADPEDESSFDSDVYPKKYDPDTEQADSAQNCASGNCGGFDLPGGAWGKFLENGLTQDGYKHVQSILNRRGGNIPPYAKEWATFYQFTYFDNPYTSAHDWLNQTIQNHAVEIKDLDGTNKHGAALVSIANELASKLDGDQIQDLFQSDMDDDDYFKQTGWYSPEME